MDLKKIMMVTGALLLASFALAGGLDSRNTILLRGGGTDVEVSPSDGAFVFSHTNANMTLPGAGQWINVTFDEEPDQLTLGITHNHNNETNTTFTVQTSGIYLIEYKASFNDRAPNPTADIVTRIVNNGIEVNGSSTELDTSKQFRDVELTGAAIVELAALDKIQLQWTSTETTVSLTNHQTYSVHPTSATIIIFKRD